MIRRWRLEIADHERGDARRGFRMYGSIDFAPLPPVGGDCHCYRGMGYFRKRHPLDCGRARCGVCHPHKRCPDSRANERRAALTYEAVAVG